MGAKGGPKTGGRKRGSQNLTVLEKEVREKIFKKRKRTPLEFFMDGMEKSYPRGRAATAEAKAIVDAYRLECAKNAAPYIHPRLQAIQVSQPPGAKDNLLFDKGNPDFLEAVRRVAFLMAAGAETLKKANHGTTGRSAETIEGQANREP